MRKRWLLWLCLWALLLCLTGCVMLEEKPLQDPQAQAMVDAVRAIPAESLQFTLYNPMAVNGAPRALATEGAAEIARNHGFSVTVCEEMHLAALQTMLADMPLTWMAESARADGGASLSLRLYDGETLVQQFTLREGQLEAVAGAVSYYFSVNAQASALLMEAVGRQPK